MNLSILLALFYHDNLYRRNKCIYPLIRWALHTHVNITYHFVYYYIYISILENIYIYIHIKDSTYEQSHDEATF